jgi:hypothetical protein
MGYFHLICSYFLEHMKLGNNKIFFYYINSYCMRQVSKGSAWPDGDKACDVFVCIALGLKKTVLTCVMDGT